MDSDHDDEYLEEVSGETSPIEASPPNDHSDSESSLSDDSPGDISTDEDSQGGDVSDHSLGHASTDEASSDDELPSDFPADDEPSDGSDSEDEVDDWPLIYPTCGLCRFHFELDDPVCIFEPKSQDLPSLWKGVYMLPWMEPEGHGEQAFHISCVDIVDSRVDIWNDLSHNVIRQLSEVTGTLSSLIEHPKSLTSQRDRWLRSSITEDLQHALKSRLPTEVCQTIASYCTQERAAQIIRDLWLGRIRRSEMSIMIPLDDQFPLWMSYVDIEGCRYVASISRSRQSQSDELLFSPKDYAGSSFTIYFSEDSRGIRRIVIRESDVPPFIHREGLRQVICCLHWKLPLCLRWKTDGVKLRGFDVTSNETVSPDWDLRRWSSLPRDLGKFPQPLAICDLYGERRNYSDGIQAIDWNAPGICGYYFYFDAADLRGIVAVTFQDSRTSHIDDFGQRGDSGIYFPVDDGERVSELWIRTGQYEYDVLPIEMGTLILRTSKKRSCVLGIHQDSFWSENHPEESKKFTYKKLATFPRVGRTRMFYSRPGLDWIWLAFEKPTNLEVWLGHGKITAWAGDISVSIPAPDDSSMVEYGSHGYFATSAPLDSVRSVRACRGWIRPHTSQIVGLLLTYTDGSQRCVGQVRPYHLEAPLEVHSDAIWLGIGLTQNVYPSTTGRNWFPQAGRIRYVYVTEPPHSGVYVYLKVPMKGRLDWRFCHYCSVVSHFDNGASRDEMKAVLRHQNLLRESERETFDVEIVARG